VFEIHHILLPTDFSESSWHALEHAVAVGRRYGSRLTALHVGNPMVVLGAFAPIPTAGTPDETTRRRLEARLRAWMAPATAAGLPTDVIIDEGNPARCILEHARTLPADLIVIGTHGYSGIDRLVLGSVTEKVLRKAACPVMTVPPCTPRPASFPLGHVLCPIDFSSSSIAALPFALSAIQEARGRLTLLHVFESPGDDASTRRIREASEFWRLWEIETTQKLERLIPADVWNWCEPELRLGIGKPCQQILDLAANDQADLIVMGVAGRNALDLTLFGSTTNQVVRQAACPVVTVRS
jgi:nucleotide-binding universal stress UspA family protein